MRSLKTSDGGAGQLDLFVGAGSDIAARDAQDLMAWPFFSLAKTKRVQQILMFGFRNNSGATDFSGAAGILGVL